MKQKKKKVSGSCDGGGSVDGGGGGRRGKKKVEGEGEGIVRREKRQNNRTGWDQGVQ